MALDELLVTIARCLGAMKVAPPPVELYMRNRDKDLENEIRKVEETIQVVSLAMSRVKRLCSTKLSAQASVRLARLKRELREAVRSASSEAKLSREIGGPDSFYAYQGWVGLERDLLRINEESRDDILSLADEVAAVLADTDTPSSDDPPAWSIPMTKTAMCKALEIKDRKTLGKHYEQAIRQVGNRQQWQIDVNKVPESQRNKFNVIE